MTRTRELSLEVERAVEALYHSIHGGSPKDVLAQRLWTLDHGIGRLVAHTEELEDTLRRIEDALARA